MLIFFQNCVTATSTLNDEFIRVKRDLRGICGRKTPSGPRPRIIGGRKTRYGDYPWQVEIKAYDKVKHRHRHRCGGALISEYHIVTAAHCVVQHSMDDLRVVLGDHRLTIRDDAEEEFTLKHIVVHPKYRQSGDHSNDLAMLRISSKYSGRGARLSDYVNPICLPVSGDKYTDGLTCSVSGWGSTHPKKKTISQTLMTASIPLLSQSECRQQDVLGRHSQDILDSMVCAGYMDGGVDACHGDSGSPLACNIGGRQVLMGIVSWGESCAEKNKPGVYTRIKYYVPWIEEWMRKHP